MYTKHLSVTLFPTCRHSGITLGWTPGSIYIKTIYNSQTVQVEKKKKKKAGRRQPFLKLEDCLAHCWDTWDIPLWQATLRRVLQKFNRRQGTVTGLGGLCMHPLPNSSGIRGMGKQFSKKAICTGLIFCKSCWQNWPSNNFWFCAYSQNPLQIFRHFYQTFLGSIQPLRF